MKRLDEISLCYLAKKAKWQNKLQTETDEETDGSEAV